MPQAPLKALAKALKADGFHVELKSLYSNAVELKVSLPRDGPHAGTLAAQVSGQ